VPRFQDIRQFIQGAVYSVDVSWSYLPAFYAAAIQDGLDINPEFQRGHVWTQEQKTRYVEFVLRGGSSGRVIHTNCPGWPITTNEHYVLVDGKQRLDAALGFINNEFPVFDGSYFRDFTDRMDTIRTRFAWQVNDLKTIDDVYEWYCDLNAGGTVHAPSEIERVRGLISKLPYERPSTDALYAQSRMDREAVQVAFQEQQRREAHCAQAAREAEVARQAAPKSAPRKKRR
jgi:hypothetical protein